MFGREHPKQHICPLNEPDFCSRRAVNQPFHWVRRTAALTRWGTNVYDIATIIATILCYIE